MISLVAVGALASVAVSAVTVEDRDRLSRNNDISTAEMERPRALRQATYGLLGATGGLSIAAVTLGGVRARPERNAEAGR